MEANRFKVLIYVIYLISSLAAGQRFVPVDNDTHEIIEDVNYSLYLEGKPVYNGVTLLEKATEINAINFDSISFSRVDYETVGFKNSNIGEVVFLSKKTIYLDELVIGSATREEIVFGETNRFVRRQSRPISKDLMWGIVFKNEYPEKLLLDRMAFYVADINFKTAYKINFSEFEETTTGIGRQFAKPGNLYYSSDVLCLNLKDSKKVVVNFPPHLYLPADKPLLVWIEVVAYYDKEGNELTPDPKEATKVKFQLSKYANLYSKTADMDSKKISESLINVNVMINYDFAMLSFGKPHKSVIVAPAILLYARKM